jgi:multiple sugar transport system ATP-binding protein
MVFQNYALYPHMTVYDNLAFGLKLRKYRKPEIEERVRKAAKILAIDSYLDRKPKALSGGQRQRVALGRAIVRQPKVFLFDEPLSNLDANLRVQMRTEISRLHHQLQTTMIYVTHDQIEAMSMGDRIVVMKDGVVQQIDSPLTIYHKPVNRFVAGFIGSPTMNFFGGSVTTNGGLRFRESGTDFSIPIGSEFGDRLKSVVGNSVTLGIRPEHLFARAPGGDAVIAKFQARIEVVEPVGNEIFVYFSTGQGTQSVARIAAENPPAVGTTYEMLVDTTKLHFFDTRTEVAL